MKVRSIHAQDLRLRIVLSALFVVITLFFAFPLLWALSLSLKDLSQLFAYPPRLLPKPPTLENYAEILFDTRVPLYVLNSLKIVTLSIMLTLVVALPASYALSRFNFRAKRSVHLGLLIFQMISLMVVAIPLYRYFSKVGLINTHLGVILMYTAWRAPFVTWVMKGFFDSIPVDLDDAAMIDGCSRLETLARIILPSSTPGIASAVIMMGVACWGQFIIPFVMLDQQNLFPISVGILNFESIQEALQTHLIGAASIVAVLPVLVLFIALQRFIVKALTAGAVKG